MQTAPPRFVGITMMPEFIQNEGIDGVLQNLTRRANVTAVATSPYVMEPADDKTGSREPPIDADAGKVRLLDRPLWGKRELFVRTAPSYAPDQRLYQGLRYQPAQASDLTKKHGAMVRDFVRAAKKSRLKVYLQVQSAIPPGYRVQFGGPAPEDLPRLPDGKVQKRKLANNGSLASQAIIDYHCALIKDLVQAYPEIDGIRVDWPEYPPYFLDDAFLDFSDPARLAAARMDIDFDRMRNDTLRFYRLLHGGLTDAMLRDRSRHSLLRWMMEYPGLVDLLRFKALLSENLLRAFRAALPKEKELMPNAFPPPLSLLSGMDFARAGAFSSAISVKLYTMHWPMMLRFWGDQLQQANPKASSAAIASALEYWLELSGIPGTRRVQDYRYPEPDEPHPVSDPVMSDKIRAAQAAAGRTPIIALAHGYGSLADFGRRLKVAYDAAGRKVWINRYGYLSNAKLDLVGKLTAAG
jgi:hypothetical protein